MADQCVWMVAREYQGWAEAGGVKDVVSGMAVGFAALEWRPIVCLPLYGFLKEKLFSSGAELVWKGYLVHSVFPERKLEVWRLIEGTVELNFFRTQEFEDKQGIYTYTEDEALNSSHEKGMGYRNSFEMNLEFQWAVAEFWFQNRISPVYLLCHDGHAGFLPALLKTRKEYDHYFQNTQCFVIIHNAGPGYRQEMPTNSQCTQLLGLPSEVLKKCHWDETWDPFVFAAYYAQLVTVSENYAQELLTGQNDFYSGSFGRFLRDKMIPLMGITNGMDLQGKDPRKTDAGIPYTFDPLEGAWEGKAHCKTLLAEKLLSLSKNVYGHIQNWNYPLYIFQSRLTYQKGVDAVCEVLNKALTVKLPANFIVLGQGERRYEQKLMWLARGSSSKGIFLFADIYEESLAKLLYASADFFLMPSEYEPCGLTDIKAQLMGCLPLVHGVGGLVKVKDGETGFSYTKSHGLWEIIRKSLDIFYNDPEKFEVLRKQAFQSALTDYHWEKILKEKYLPWMSCQYVPGPMA